MKHLIAKHSFVWSASAVLILSAGCSSSKKDVVDRENMPLDAQEALVQKCYASALAQGKPGEPADEGEVEVSVGVSPGGRVAHASVIRSTMNSKRLEDCVLGVVRESKFGKDPSGRALNTTHVYRFSKSK